MNPAGYPEVLHTSLARPRMLLGVLSLFAVTARLLASVGVAGVVAYAVRERRREYGIRQALGAAPRQIVGASLRQGLLLGGVGLGLGTAAAAGLGPLLSGFLFGVAPVDPPSIGGVAFVVALVVVTASWIPARRAGRIDPAECLRE